MGLATEPPKATPLRLGTSSSLLFVGCREFVKWLLVFQVWYIVSW